jgi:hypothetical protein
MRATVGRRCAAAAMFVLSAPLAVACAGGTTPMPTTTPPAALRASFDFRTGDNGWVAGFSDYPPGQEQFFELDSGIRALPTEIGSANGYFIAGNNHSDDLFMFLKRKLGQAEGVKPSTTYRLKFTIVVASNAPSGCYGVGGAPGGVPLKAGGSDIEPQPVVQSISGYRMNVDKDGVPGGLGGPAGEIVGTIANGIPCEQTSPNNQPFVSLTKQHTGAFTVKSSAQGDLWLLVGTDSGFEGKTALYYQRIDVELPEST